MLFEYPNLDLLLCAITHGPQVSQVLAMISCLMTKNNFNANLHTELKITVYSFGWHHNSDCISTGIYDPKQNTIFVGGLHPDHLFTKYLITVPDNNYMDPRAE